MAGWFRWLKLDHGKGDADKGQGRGFGAAGGSRIKLSKGFGSLKTGNRFKTERKKLIVEKQEVDLQ